MPGTEQLRPSEIARIEVEGVHVFACAWPLVFAEQGLGTGALRAKVDGEVHWLGRASGSQSISLDGVEHPAVVEVPITWVSTVLRWIARRDDLWAFFPWLREPGFEPVHEWRAERYSLEGLRAHPQRVEELCTVVERRVDDAGPAGFAAVIAELRRVGHDLWSLDAFPDGELWGGDYMRPAEGRLLQVEVAYDPVSVQITLEPQG